VFDTKRPKAIERVVGSKYRRGKGVSKTTSDRIQGRGNEDNEGI
jgi:hypothetical protein